MSYSRIKAAAANVTWAIDHVWLEAAIEQVANDSFVATRKLPNVKGNVAIIPIHGMITQRGSVFDNYFGGTSTEAFEGAFSRALASPRINAVVLDIDSPGGTVPGVQQASQRVYDARTSGKPVVAVANSMAASAAYWVGSAAQHFVADPSADVGSIGVFRMHADVSRMLDEDGVNITFVAEPEYKVEGNPYSPLSDEALSHQRDQVHETYVSFNSDVARNRGVTPANARENFGKGRTFHGETAAKMGLVDRVVTMQKVLTELGVGKAGRSAEAAAELCEAWESGEVTELRQANVETSRKRLSLDETARKWNNPG